MGQRGPAPSAPTHLAGGILQAQCAHSNIKAVNDASDHLAIVQGNLSLLALRTQPVEGGGQRGQMGVRQGRGGRQECQSWEEITHLCIHVCIRQGISSWSLG